MTAFSGQARRPSLVLAMTTIAVVLAAYPSPDPVRAQDFPNRPIKLMVGPSPDVHTLLFATPTYTLNAAMKLASYDLVKEFEPVSIVGLISYALVVHPSVPARSVAELVALAKARPGGSTVHRPASAPSRISPARP